MFSARTGTVSFLIDGYLRQDLLGFPGSTKLRDFIHVDDVVTAILRLVEVDFEGIINIGTGKGVTLRELATALEAFIPIPEAPRDLPDGIFPTFSYVADVSKLNSVFPHRWRPSKEVLSSLPDLIEFRKKEMEFYSRSNPMAVLNAMRGVKSG
jgi:nucleoside-diphosphate-sugar epimerase